MIFVTVGTHEQSFNRLVEAVDKYAYKKKLKKNDIFIQIGYSDYQPKYCNYNRMLTYEEMDKLYYESDIVITHGGPGSMFVPWKYGKKIVAVPRLSRFNEHVDDHQLYFCRLMQEESKVTCIEHIEELEKLLESLANQKSSGKSTYTPKTNQFIEKFQEHLTKLW